MTASEKPEYNRDAWFSPARCRTVMNDACGPHTRGQGIWHDFRHPPEAGTDVDAAPCREGNEPRATR